MRCSGMLTNRHAERFKHDPPLQIHKGNETVNPTPPGSAHSGVSCSCSKPENPPHCVAQTFHSVIGGL